MDDRMSVMKTLYNKMMTVKVADTEMDALSAARTAASALVPADADPPRSALVAYFAPHAWDRIQMKAFCLALGPGFIGTMAGDLTADYLHVSGIAQNAIAIGLAAAVITSIAFGAEKAMVKHLLRRTDTRINGMMRNN